MGNSLSKSVGIGFIVFGILILIIAGIWWFEQKPTTNSNTGNMSLYLLGGLGFFFLLIGILLLIWGSYEDTPTTAKDIKMVHVTSAPVGHHNAITTYSAPPPTTVIQTNPIGQAGTYPSGVNHRATVSKAQNPDGSITVHHDYSQEIGSDGMYTDPGTNMSVHNGSLPMGNSVTTTRQVPTVTHPTMITQTPQSGNTVTITSRG